MNAAKGVATSTFWNKHLCSDDTNVKLFELIVGGGCTYLGEINMAMAYPQECLPQHTATDSACDGDAGECGCSIWGENRHLLWTTGLQAIWPFGLGDRAWEGLRIWGARVWAIAAREVAKKRAQAVGARNPFSRRVLEHIDNHLHDHTRRRRHQPRLFPTRSRVPKP